MLSAAVDRGLKPRPPGRNSAEQVRPASQRVSRNGSRNEDVSPMSADSLNSQASAAATGRSAFHRRLFHRLRRYSSPSQSSRADQQLLMAYNFQTAVEFNLKSELYVCKRKLVSKCEALGVLCRELDKLREEREEFKALAQQAHARCQIMRRALGFGELLEEQMKPMTAEGGDESVLRQLLFECIEHNKALQIKNAELQESLTNVQGDMRLLRLNNHHQHQQQQQQQLDPVWVEERCRLVEQLEEYTGRLNQLQSDLRTLLDEKEELVVERDALRGKYDRVNCELNYILKGDAGKILDIDAVVMENRYLQERLNQMEEERAMAYQAVSKYKSMLERHKTAVFDSLVTLHPQQQQQQQKPQSQPSASTSSLSSDAAGATTISTTSSTQPVITQKTVKSLISTLNPTVATLRDLQSLAKALLDTIQDKNLALTHQRKANRLLAERVADLERQASGMECSGYWRNACSVFIKARSLDDVRNLFPERVPGCEENGGIGADDRDRERRSGEVEDGLDRWPCRDPEGLG